MLCEREGALLGRPEELSLNASLKCKGFLSIARICELF